MHKLSTLPGMKGFVGASGVTSDAAYEAINQRITMVHKCPLLVHYHHIGAIKLAWKLQRANKNHCRLFCNPLI